MGILHDICITFLGILVNMVLFIVNFFVIYTCFSLLSVSVSVSGGLDYCPTLLFLVASKILWDNCLRGFLSNLAAGVAFSVRLYVILRGS